MYEEFYGLRERPFDLTPNPRYLVPTEIHREALSNLEYAIAGRKGVTLLVGDAGAGKTTVIRAAIAGQSDLTHCVHLHNPTLTRLEFMEMLAARFGLSDRALTSKTALLLELEQLLRGRRDAHEVTVLIVDEAHSLPFELLEEVRLLANIETDSEKLLSLIIAGQPEIAEHLNHPSLRQLKQRIELRCALRPLQRLETFTYLAVPHPGSRRCRDAKLHARGGRGDPRAVVRKPAHHQRHRRQLVDRGARPSAAPGLGPNRRRGVPGVRRSSRWRATSRRRFRKYHTLERAVNPRETLRQTALEKISRRQSVAGTRTFLPAQLQGRLAGRRSGAPERHSSMSRVHEAMRFSGKLKEEPPALPSEHSIEFVQREEDSDRSSEPENTMETAPPVAPEAAQQSARSAPGVPSTLSRELGSASARPAASVTPQLPRSHDVVAPTPSPIAAHPLPHKSEDDIRVTDLLVAIYRGRWLILAVIVVFVGAAFVYNSNVTPIYEARARLVIEQSTPQVVTFRPVEAEDLRRIGTSRRSWRSSAAGLSLVRLWRSWEC